MSHVTPEELWAIWNKGEVMPKHVMGQVVQILMIHERSLAEHGVSLVGQQGQLTRLEKAQSRLRKLVETLKSALEKVERLGRQEVADLRKGVARLRRLVEKSSKS